MISTVTESSIRFVFSPFRLFVILLPLDVGRA